MIKNLAISALLVLLVASCSSQKSVEVELIQEVAPIDSTNSAINRGVAAMFFGELQGSVIVAGGANFPDVPVADGGAKRFYDRIYTLKDGEWTFSGNLFDEAASGNSIKTRDALYFIGGANSNGSLSTVSKVTLGADNQLQIEAMPALPYSVQQSASVLMDSVIYVISGLQNEMMGTEILAYDLSESTDSLWHKVGDLPEPMLQPVAGAYNNEIFIWGGYTNTLIQEDGKSITWGYKFNPKEMQFTKIDGSKLGTMVGTTLEILDGKFYLVGGVNKDIFASALIRKGKMLRGEENNDKLLKEEYDYMTMKPEEYNFIDRIQIFDPSTSTWSYSEPNESYALAGAGVVTLGDEMVVINGELKPGVRTNKVFKVRYDKIK